MSEATLRDFHRRHAGRGHELFGRARSDDGRTSHQRLADSIPSHARRVLDLGCGDASLLSILIARGHQGAGVDISPEELAAARARLPAAALFQARAQALPFEGGSFDAIVSHMALMLMQDPDVVITEAARVLRPGGTLAFVVSAGPSTSPAFDLVFSCVRSLRAAERPQPVLGDPRTASVDALRALLADRFAPPEVQDFEIRLEVASAEILSFLELSYYTIDQLGPASREALAAFVETHREALAPSGAMAWSYALRRMVTERI